MNNSGRARRGLTRKDFLRTSGGVLAGAYLMGLAGCGQESGSDSGLIQLPNSGANLPEGDVTFRLADSGDTKAAFWEELAQAYQEAHSNITFEYDALPIARLEETIPLGIRNESAHDIFQYVGGITPARAAREGWTSPLDDIIPSFEEWKAAFPPNTFFEGIHIFDGKMYVFPPTSPRRIDSLLLYSRELMEDAGYDPSSQALTWDEYRDAARKITERGDGNTYGVVLEVAQPPRLEVWVHNLAYMAGGLSLPPPGLLINPRNGEYAYTSDEYLAAIELLLALKSDGSIFPGSSSLLAPEAWPRVPQGNAAMVTGGAWVFQQWEEDVPDFEFGVGSHPVPGNGDFIPLPYTPEGFDPLGVFSGSELKELAGDVLSYLGSPDGQRAWGSIAGVGTPPVMPDALEAVANKASPQGQRAAELYEQVVLAPAAQVRNPETEQVFLEMDVISPNFGETIQALFVGEMEDPRKAMQDLKDRSERELDRAIEAAKANGAEVSRDDWVFPNWDPRRDYIQEDYDAL